MIAYDKGVTWQVQVKSCHGKQQRIDVRNRNPRAHIDNPTFRGRTYEYIDTFIAVNLATNEVYTMPAWIPLPGQITIKGMTPISPDVMRCPELHCLLDAHTCDTTCNKCRPHLKAMSATDRKDYLLSYLGASGSPRIIEANEKGVVDNESGYQHTEGTALTPARAGDGQGAARRVSNVDVCPNTKGT